MRGPQKSEAIGRRKLWHKTRRERRVYHDVQARALQEVERGVGDAG